MRLLIIHMLLFTATTAMLPTFLQPWGGDELLLKVLLVWVPFNLYTGMLIIRRA